MGNFRDNRSGGGRSYGGGRSGYGGDRGGDRGGFGGNRDGGDRQMFRTTCSNCGKDCEVPFKPTGSKPVYCSDCFQKMGGPDSRRPNFNNDNRGSSQPSQPNYREHFEALNAKLDKILNLLGQDTPQPKQKTQKPVVEKVKEVDEETIFEAISDFTPVDPAE